MLKLQLLYSLFSLLLINKVSRVSFVCRMLVSKLKDLIDKEKLHPQLLVI